MKRYLIIVSIIFLSFNCYEKVDIQSNDINSEQLKNTSSINIKNVRSVAVKDKIVFIVGSNELASVDINNPYHPKVLSKVPLVGVGYDIELKDSYAFVASRMGGIHVFDIKNPSIIRYITTYDSLEQATGMAVNGNILICCNRTVGVEVVDISNPEKPLFIGKIKMAEAQGAKCRGNYAYIGEHSKKAMTILDISMPSKPSIVRSVKVPGNAWGIAIKGDFAYVAHGHGGHGVSVIDIKDPQKAEVVMTYNIPLIHEERSPDCWEVQISGNYLFFANGYDGLYVFDISNPEKLQLLTSYKDVNYAHDLAITKDMIILADYQNGCQLISAKGIAGEQYIDAGIQPEIIRTEYNPSIQEEGMIKYFSKGQIHSFFLDDHYIYMACGTEGLEIADIFNPQKVIAKLKTGGIAYDVVVSDNVAYLSCGAKGLQVIDLKDIQHPELIKTIGEGRFLNDMWINHDRIILRTDPWATTGCVDISNTRHPKISANDLKIDHFMHQVSDDAFNEDYFAAANWKSLLILKYNKNPLSVEKIARIPENTSGVAVKGKYVYRTSWKKDLYVYNAEIPAAPKEVYHEVMESSFSPSEKLSLDDDKLYITIDQSVMIYDVKDADKPKFIKEITIPGIKGNHIYGRIKSKYNKLFVCTGYSGLWIIEDKCK